MADTNATNSSQAPSSQIVGTIFPSMPQAIGGAILAGLGYAFLPKHRILAVLGGWVLGQVIVNQYDNKA